MPHFSLEHRPFPAILKLFRIPARAGRPAGSGGLSPLTISLQDFVHSSCDELLDSLNRANPACLRRVSRGQSPDHPCRPEAEVVPASSLDRHLPSPSCWSIVAEPRADACEERARLAGGKTTVGIATAACSTPKLISSLTVWSLATPPGLQSGGAEIQETVAGAKVWCSKRPDTLVQAAENCASSWA